MFLSNIPNTSNWSNSLVGSNNAHKRKPKPKKKLNKMNQSVRCEICDIVCTSIELYEKHLAGKKHMKTLKKKYAPHTTSVQPNSQNSLPLGLIHFVKESSIQDATSASMGEDHVPGKRNGNQGVAITTMSEHGMEGASSKGVDEDLDAKKQNVMESGVVEASMNVCSSGDAGCKSDLPSADHITGEKRSLQGASTSVVGGHNNNEALSVSSGQNLGTKKQKLIQCGVAAGSMRVCTVCNIVCNSEVVFADHIAGKKHIAQTQKAAGIAVTGGMPAGGVRACVLCNIVCNSDSVFNSHLAGQKHASMVRKMVQGQTSMEPAAPPAAAS